jgi:hypothetical protein
MIDRPGAAPPWPGGTRGRGRFGPRAVFSRTNIPTLSAITQEINR